MKYGITLNLLYSRNIEYETKHDRKLHAAWDAVFTNSASFAGFASYSKGLGEKTGFL